MHCGQPIAAQQRPAPAPQQPFPQQAYQQAGGRAPAPAFPVASPDQARKTTLMAVGVAVLVLILAFFGLQAAGVLQLGGSDGSRASLSAKGSNGDNSLLKVRGAGGGPVLDKTAKNQKPAEMPQDVWDWLEHLRRIEARKNELHLRQVSDLKKFQLMIGTLGPAIGELDPYDQTGGTGKEPTDVAATKFNDLRPEWRQLIADFQSVPPPEECKPIANDFFRAINEIPGMTGDIMDVLNNVSSGSADPSAMLAEASKLRNKSYDNIDVYLISTDKRVQDICDKYNKKKWFNIKTDVAGSGMLGKMGF
jgi:hypothetical protein